jgi:hypothetical protein
MATDNGPKTDPQTTINGVWKDVFQNNFQLLLLLSPDFDGIQLAMKY